MPWRMHATDRPRSEYGDDQLLRHAERLEGILRRNDLPVPDFPALIWSQERLPRGVEVAVIEAGLGGRYDATNVIPSRVQVLTGVGLEHTRWLGPTIGHIAAEKLDVVQPVKS